MKKHEREAKQEELATRVLLEVEKAIENADFKEATRLMKLYNQLDKGW